jgi:hypothetical protein
MTCPYCGSELGELDPIMDILSQDKSGGSTTFKAKCCRSNIKAYSATSMYYIVAADPLPEGKENKPQLIGGA